MNLDKDGIDRIRAADINNLIKKVKAGKTLTQAERNLLDELESKGQEPEEKKKQPPQYKEHPDGYILEVSKKDLCLALDVSQREIGRLEKSGIVERIARNRYDLLESNRRYIKHKTRESPEADYHRRKLIAETLLAEHNERLKQLQLEQEQGDLVPTDIYKDVVITALHPAAKGIKAIAKRVAPKANPADPATAEEAIRIETNRLCKQIQNLLEKEPDWKNAKSEKRGGV